MLSLGCRNVKDVRHNAADFIVKVFYCGHIQRLENARRGPPPGSDLRVPEIWATRLVVRANACGC